MKYIFMIMLFVVGCADKQKIVEKPSIDRKTNSQIIVSNKINTSTYVSNIFPFTNDRDTATEPPLYSCRGLIPEYSDEQIDAIRASIENGDHSVLIPFMSRDLI